MLMFFSLGVIVVTIFVLWIVLRSDKDSEQSKYSTRVQNKNIRTNDRYSHHVHDDIYSIDLSSDD